MGRLEKKYSDYGVFDLNEDNVQMIFNQCLATQDTPKDRIIQAKIVSGKLFIGDIVQSFDKNAIQANR